MTWGELRDRNKIVNNGDVCKIRAGLVNLECRTTPLRPPR